MADHIGMDYYKNTEAASYAAPAKVDSTAAADIAGHYDALFNISAGSVIKNVNAVNIHTGNYDAEHSSAGAAGIICGFIIEAKVVNCTADATSSATAAHAAGMAVVSFGGAGSTVQDCVCEATITGSVASDPLFAHLVNEKDKVEFTTEEE